MRSLSRALLALFCLIGGARASDVPTLKPTSLPDVSVPQTAPIAPIDLRNYFEISSVQGQVVQFQTSMGTVNMEMLANAAPASVSNFLNYVSSGRYPSTFVHRSDQQLGIIQAGGYIWPSLAHVTTDAPIALEYNLPNTRGTVAMARTSALNSATSEWFINRVDNSTTLGQANGGGYAVFARVIGTGMTVVDAIGQLPVYAFQSPFGQLPLTGYAGSGAVAQSNLVMINAAQVVPLFPATPGETAVASFSVTNSNPGLLTASVQGSALSLTPVSGQLGTASITVTATDSNGNSVQDTFTVTIVPPFPVIAVEQPAGTSLADGATRALGTVNVGDAADFIFTIRNTGTANLNLTGSPRVAIDGANANEFSVTAQPATPVSPSGTRTFTVRVLAASAGAKTAALHIANDDSSSGVFDLTMTAQGNFKPSLTLPSSPIVLEATSSAGAVATFNVSAADQEDGALPATATPPSGSTFPVGTTNVSVSATDSAGAKTTSTFAVQVRDTTAPSATAPTGTITLATDRSGMAVLPDYFTAVNATDIVGVTAHTQTPAAGTSVAPGLVPVSVTVRDAAANEAQVSFDVQVVTGTSRLVAKGGAVPGAGVDPRIPENATWGTFGVPSITMDSGVEVGWSATVLVPKATAFTGIFSGPPDAPQLRLRTGEAATGADGQPLSGVTFKAFRSPVFAGSDFAFGATLTGKGVVPLVNDTGLWVSSAGTLRGIARTGTAATGAGTAKFLAITSVAMPAPGSVFFVGKLVAPIGKDLGLWAWTPSGGTTLIARTGSLVDLGAGPMTLKSFTALSSVAGSLGHGRYDPSAGTIDVLLTTTTGVTAIASAAADGTLHLTQRSGVTDGAGRSVKSLGIPSSAGQGQLASAITTFLPNATLGLTTANSRTTFDFGAEAIRAQIGTIAPGAGNAKFLTFQNPVAGLGRSGQRITAFGATLTGTTVDRDTGIWAHSADGGLALVAREGFEPPGAPRTKWTAFSSLSVLEGRGPIFTARLLQVAPTVTAANDRGLWATDSSGVLRLLVRTGDMIDGHKLSSFALLGAVAGSPGQRRAWTSGDPSAHVVYQAAFTDGSSAIVNTLVP